MPARRKTRLASRAKPLLPTDSETSTLDEEQRKIKLEAYLKDFDIEVEKRIAEMQRLCSTICSQIQSASTMYLLRLPKEVKKMKQADYFEQSGIPTREKVIEEISKTVDEMVSRKMPEMSQASETEGDVYDFVSTDSDCNEQSTTRKTRTTRKKTATARKKETTAKRTSSRKRNRPALQETAASQDNTRNLAFQTPASNMPMSSLATPFITPKFDPSSKMTPATARRAKKGELLVSLSGSPVEAKNSPNQVQSVERLKENMETFFSQDQALNEVDRKNIVMLQETLTRMLKEKTKVKLEDA